MRIAVVCPGSRLPQETAERVQALAAERRPDAELVFHPQCFASSGHFAGTDAERADAFVEAANDPSVDAVWFGRGGYGSGRMTPLALPRLKSAAGDKAYLGYSDMGVLLAALYGAGVGRPAHGPLVNDLVRDGGEAAVLRALDWLVAADSASLEPSLVGETRPAAAFNLATFSSIIGTPWQPELTGHVLMLEEVSEHMYRIDRYLMHVTANLGVRAAAGLKLGRCSLVPPNDPEFGLEEEAVAQNWCERSGLAWLGRADIGHDADNRVVPFGPR